MSLVISKFGIMQSKKWTLPEGITNEWLFEEVAPNIIDTIGYANLTKPAGALFPTGLVGNCIDLVGSDYCGYGSGIFGDICSFSFSIKIPSSTSIGVFGQAYDPGGGSWHGWCFKMSGNGIYLLTGNGSNTANTRTYSHSFDSNVWHNIAITKNGSIFKVYYGDANEIVGSGSVYNIYLSEYFRLGQAGIGYLGGIKQIDQFRGYNNYILTNEDMVNLWNKGKGR